MPKKTPPTDDDGADPDFFDDAYFRLLVPLHTEEDARLETAALRELLGLAQSDRILDLGCGWGRHLRLLAEAGHDVVGLDLSVALLRRARTGGPAGVAGSPPATGAPPTADRPLAADSRRAAHAPLVAGDMLRIPLADRCFDVVLNLASSLGLFLDDAAAVRALAEACRVLRPGGRFLIEGMHRADVEAHFAPRDAWTLADGTEVRARRRWDADAGVSHEVLRWHGPGGSGEKRHSLRVRSARELERLLDGAGLEITARFGGWTGQPFEAGAPRLIALARR